MPKVRRAFSLLSKYPAKQKERAGKVPQGSAASEHTLLSKDVFNITYFRICQWIAINSKQNRTNIAEYL